MKTLILKDIAAEYSNNGHSIFGPSSSHMWLKCAGSLIPNILAQDDGNPDAAYGTVAHDVTDVWLSTRKRPKHLIGTKQIVYSGDWGYLVTIDEEMMEHAQSTVDRCILLPGEQMTEFRVDFSRLTPIPNQGGTLDFAAVDGGVATVIDHKFGKGHKVYAEGNTQAMLYALGLLYRWDEKYKFQRFVLRIHQPRLDHYDEWEISRDDLIEFGGYVRERAKAAWRIDAPRTADPKACHFCKVKSTCTANVQMQFRLMAAQTEIAFNEVDHSDLVAFQDSLTEGFTPQVEAPLTLSTAQLAALKPYTGMVERWWKSANHELLRRAIAGEDVPNYKVVEGRTHRKFESDSRTVKALTELGIDRNALVTEQLVSPADAERLLIKAGHRRVDIPNLLDGLVCKPPGKPTLAPLSDRREAMRVDLSNVAWGDDSTDSDESEEL